MFVAFLSVRPPHTFCRGLTLQLVPLFVHVLKYEKCMLIDIGIVLGDVPLGPNVRQIID